MFVELRPQEEKELGGVLTGDSPVLTASQSEPSSADQTNLINPAQIGGLAGEIPTASWFSEFENIVRDSSRFLVNISYEETVRQIGNPGKYLSRLNLEPFNPKNEKELEDWLDIADAQVIAKRVCAELVLEAWAAAAPAHHRKLIRSCANLSGLEETADKVAKKLFGYSGYVKELELELLRGTPRKTVAESIDHLEKIGARFVRLRRRWEREAIISNPNIRESFLNTLPVSVQKLVIVRYEAKTLQQIIDSALKAEELLTRKNAKSVHFSRAIETFAAAPWEQEDEQLSPEEEGMPRANPHLRRPFRPNCSVCGLVGHLNKDCHYRNARCANCNLIGHVSAACRNLAVKDKRGTVRTLVQNKPSETTVTAKRDHTTQDRLHAATDVIEGITRLVTDRSNRGKEIRAQKSASDPNRKRTAIPHPIAIATAKDKAIPNSDDEDSIGLTEMFCLNEGVDASMTKHSIEKNLAVTASINGIEMEVVIDTGASASMCSEEVAWRCGLIRTEVTQKFTRAWSRDSHSDSNHVSSE